MVSHTGSNHQLSNYQKATIRYLSETKHTPLCRIYFPTTSPLNSLANGCSLKPNLKKLPTTISALRTTCNKSSISSHHFSSTQLPANLKYASNHYASFRPATTKIQGLVFPVRRNLATCNRVFVFFSSLVIGWFGVCVLSEARGGLFVGYTSDGFWWRRGGGNATDGCDVQHTFIGLLELKKLARMTRCFPGNDGKRIANGMYLGTKVRGVRIRYWPVVRSDLLLSFLG